ncbi:winged helix DNA-binding domain-containing protein [Streptomyces abyssomicinicus]|uniref:winged helix DNA-binding domain-containing protein n=1 Tax=Streptomyces abyssomicinicus TaxID=574929 RepID=UPI0015832AAB|nr:winged helix DNA-binding domain-containing protein [Streptomyces abyssomicinicus]
MRTITVEQRRARLGRRHLLTPGDRAADPAEAARSVVALHGTDPSSVHLSCWARTTGCGVAEVERALYDDRTLIRLLAMRRTVFVTTLDRAAVLQAACSRDVAARERRKLVTMLAESGLGDGTGPGAEHWLAGAEAAALASLEARGEATAAELAADDPRLAERVVIGRGSRNEARPSVAARLLLLLAADGRAVRGRPRGSWTSHQYRWSPLERWCPQGLADLPDAEAATELARLWLRSFGPAPAEDLQWWTGWTRTRTRQALAGLDLVEADLDGTPGLLLADDQDDVPEPEPWAALLPALDPTPMGWQRREWFLGPHGPKLFDRAGNIGPSVWWNGRVVGGWTTDERGRVVHRFLEDVGAGARAAVRAEADRLTALLDGTRITPRTRGRTWLEDEVAATMG